MPCDMQAELDVEFVRFSGLRPGSACGEVGLAIGFCM